MTDSSWLGVVAVAFGAQLAVLPGEKVQFVIAGLSTRFDPRVVVAAATTAFAGWTALEVWLGAAITRAVPAFYLDALTAALFVLFAAALASTAPKAGGDAGPAAGVLSDGGELDVRVPLAGWRVPNWLGGFVPMFAVMAFGEVGDKTQLITVALAARYPDAASAVWTGEMLAIVPVSALNAFLCHRFAHRLDRRTVHFAGAALFAFFAADFALEATVGVSAWETLVGTVAGAVGV